MVSYISAQMSTVMVGLHGSTCVRSIDMKSIKMGTDGFDGLEGLRC